MNPNYNQTITIYNCFRAVDNPDSKQDVWKRTVLQECFYKNMMEKVAVGNGLKMVNSYTVRIPKSDIYMPYCDWIKLSDEERLLYFTCSLNDIVVKGECEEEIMGASPQTAAELISRNKPDAFIITAFSDNTSHRHGKHYRLGG